MPKENAPVPVPSEQEAEADALKRVADAAALEANLMEELTGAEDAGDDDRHEEATTPASDAGSDTTTDEPSAEDITTDEPAAEDSATDTKSEDDDEDHDDRIPDHWHPDAKRHAKKLSRNLRQAVRQRAEAKEAMAHLELESKAHAQTITDSGLNAQAVPQILQTVGNALRGDGESQAYLVNLMQSVGYQVQATTTQPQPPSVDFDALEAKLAEAESSLDFAQLRAHIQAAKTQAQSAPAGTMTPAVQPAAQGAVSPAAQPAAHPMQPAQPDAQLNHAQRLHQEATARAVSEFAKRDEMLQKNHGTEFEAIKGQIVKEMSMIRQEYGVAEIPPSMAGMVWDQAYQRVKAKHAPRRPGAPPVRNQSHGKNPAGKTMNELEALEAELTGG